MHDISKNYELGKITVKALHSIDLSIEAGDFLVIAGSSGSGKTTLLNLIGLIDTPTSGSIYFDSKELDGNERRLTEYRRDRLGYIFQTFNLIPVMNVYENVEFPLILQGVSQGQRKQLVMDVLEQVGLTGHHRHKPRELSGGQRQRVAIARAIVKKPDIVLADEPTANLDSVTGEEIIELMEKLNAHNGTTFVFSSHDPMIITRGRRIIRLHDGQIIREKEAA
ncbi:ABC transporter ATP-binding protein [bacterium]|nr:ABC transporter ATP-binding protein [bacterium]